MKEELFKDVLLAFVMPYMQRQQTVLNDQKQQQTYERQKEEKVTHIGRHHGWSACAPFFFISCCQFENSDREKLTKLCMAMVQGSI